MKKSLMIFCIVLISFLSFCKSGKDSKVPETVFVKGAHIKLGDNSDKISNNYPEHYVLVRDFNIGKYEITNMQYKYFLDDNQHWKKSNIENLINKKLVSVDYLSHWNGDSYPEKLKNHPIVYVSYFAAVAYCSWLSNLTGKNYRLPTEAEWEYTAGNGEKRHPFSIFPFDKKEITYADNQGPENSTREIGSHKSNELGIYDMTGNVWELTMTLFKRYPYQPSFVDSMKITKNDEKIVIRGGSFLSYMFYTLTSFRNFIYADHTSEEIGFRVAMSD
jgi:formylglycine-generating enzyme required for sulfatase activity